jgi:peroxiredoxin
MKMKKIILLFTLILLSCAKAPNKAVVWSPLEPKENEEITISYYPQAKDALIKDPEDLVLIYQITYPDTEILKTTHMEKKGSSWQGKIKLEEKGYLASFKFEDKKGRTDDNDGLGWNLIVRTREGKVPMGAHLALGKAYGMRNEVQEGPQEALNEYLKELELYPENYKALGYKWGTELNLSAEPEKLKKEIKAQMDSLVKIYPDEPQILSLAYSVYSYSLNDKDKGMAFGERFVENFPEKKEASNIAYYMIYQKYGNDLKSQIVPLENFVKEFPHSEEAKYVYFDLERHYKVTGQKEKTRQMYRKHLELDPKNILILLFWAGMEMEEKNYNEAEKLIGKALSNCTLDDFLTSSPWYSYEQRLVFQKDALSEIYSYSAQLNFEKGDYKKSLENWEKALAQAPRQTSYIWTGMGIAYQRLEDKNKAKEAYLQALLSNPDEVEAKDSLLSLYKNETGEEKGFEEYLQKEILGLSKSSAAPAPDFDAIDLTRNKLKLSQIRGKVVVLYFWATWCGGCQYLRPENNKLFEQFKDNPKVEFWAISTEGKKSIEDYLQRNEFKYHQFYGGKKILGLYGYVLFPTHFIIDKKGFIRFKYVGPIPGIKEKMAQDINNLLKETT